MGILDLFGRGFVLLRFGTRAPDTQAMQDAAKASGLPLTVVDIDHEAAAQLYERRLVLVRPDGQVAWRADALPADCTALINRVRGASTTHTAASRAASTTEA